MARGMKEDRTTTKGGSSSLTLPIMYYFLFFTGIAVPVAGFTLRDQCRMSDTNVICRPIWGSLKAVPRDIPQIARTVDLSSNKISKIKATDFKNLPLVTQLDLKRNLITEIDAGAFANLVSLTKLLLNNNRLAKLDDDLFSGLRNLTELRITSNRIKELAPTCFKSLTSLNFLDISHNKLHSATRLRSVLQQLPNLQTLLITNNELTHFQSMELTNSSLKLVMLDVSQNPIAVFRITADIFPKLTWLNIGSTMKQKMIWDIQNKTFLQQVSTLDVSGLQLKSGDWRTFLESFNSSLMALRMNNMRWNLTELISISCTIPTVTSLQLRQNKLIFIHSNLFKLCGNVTEIDLSNNRIREVEDGTFLSLKGLKILSLNRNILPSVPAATRNLPTLQELDLSRNKITMLECHDFANLTRLKQLSLYNNSIPTLNECAFKDLIRLQVLKLQGSQISKLNGAFKRHLPYLKQLRLSGNKLTVIKHGEFKGLQSLQNLSLHENQIQVLDKGCFTGLGNLTDLQLQSNNIDSKKFDQGCFIGLMNLRRLDLRDNHIAYKSSAALEHPPFSQLPLLETLAFLSQHHRGKSWLPCNLLQGLGNLLIFYTRNTQLVSLHKDTFKYTPKLQILELSSNYLKDLSSDLFRPIQNLKSLYISRISLQSLDFLIDANLTKLEFLQARMNAYPVIRKEEIKALPSLAYIDLYGQTFKCDCDNAWILNWTINDNRTQVFDAYNFECNYPLSLKGTKLLDMDIKSCTVNTEFICFISTTCTTLLFMMGSFIYHFLRLQLVYAYYLFMAYLFDSKRKNKQSRDEYDAFISYNAQDEPWVIRELMPKLEGEQGWKLCLHHRDFEPGKPIMENITDAIYGSRKTICVISQRYLESEWCSREITLASFRLFDEQKDVLIIVFLEEIPTARLSPYYRMRKVLKKQTYLSWPRAQENTDLFWEKLRQAMKTKENHEEDRFQLTVADQ